VAADNPHANGLTVHILAATRPVILRMPGLPHLFADSVHGRLPSERE
jgi:hypothetical protein